MKVRLTQIDGKLPNLALMHLSAHHKAVGDDVHFTRDVDRGLFEPDYDRVYGSAIFTFSEGRQSRFRLNFPDAIVGGTGTQTPTTVEDLIGDGPVEYDYSIYPDYEYSIGFLQRGCRLRCKFCVVPGKEGKPRLNMTVEQLWRGGDHPRKLHLLDNDFFGIPEWPYHIERIRAGGFKVCFNQGINVRFITEDSAAAIASVEYRDDQFKQRRLYTAWDNLKDERIFFRGMDRLEKAGVPAKHVMAYMLVGFDPEETWTRIHHRFDRMVERGILPYPMVYDRSRADLRAFQRWAIRGLYKAIPFDQYDRKAEGRLRGERCPGQIGMRLT